MKKIEARRPGEKGCQNEALSVRSCSYLWDGRDRLETGQGEVRVTETIVCTLSESGFHGGYGCSLGGDHMARRVPLFLLSVKVHVKSITSQGKPHPCTGFC